MQVWAQTTLTSGGRVGLFNNLVLCLVIGLQLSQKGNARGLLTVFLIRQRAEKGKEPEDIP